MLFQSYYEYEVWMIRWIKKCVKHWNRQCHTKKSRWILVKPCQDFVSVWFVQRCRFHYFTQFVWVLRPFKLGSDWKCLDCLSFDICCLLLSALWIQNRPVHKPQEMLVGWNLFWVCAFFRNMIFWRAATATHCAMTSGPQRMHSSHLAVNKNIGITILQQTRAGYFYLKWFCFINCMLAIMSKIVKIFCRTGNWKFIEKLSPIPEALKVWSFSHA